MRPLILREETKLRLQSLLVLVRRGDLRDLVGHAVQEPVRHVTDHLAGERPRAFLELHARLERMGAGHVRGGEPLDEAVADARPAEAGVGVVDGTRSTAP